MLRTILLRALFIAPLASVAATGAATAEDRPSPPDSAAGPAAQSASAAPRDLSGIQQEIRLGRTLRIRGDFGSMIGTVRSADAVGLHGLRRSWLDWEKSPVPDMLPWTRISSVHRKGTMAGRGALIGALVLGAVGGALAGTVSSGSFGFDAGGNADTGAVVAGAVAGTLVGAGVGLAIGHAVITWHPVPGMH